MMRGFCLFLWVLSISTHTYSSSSVRIRLPILRSSKKNIYQLEIKSRFLDKSNLTIIAKDSIGREENGINGIYPIEINGFEYRLFFIFGKASFPGKLRNSTLVSLKALDETVTQPSFYLLIRWPTGIYPQKVSVFWLIGIPLVILILCFLFRKLILVFGVVLILFFIFNKGVDPIHLFHSIYDWIIFHLRHLLK